jgi:GT2 family glycosyltransferase
MIGESVETLGAGSNGEGVPVLFVLVLNWNGWEELRECLESLLRSGHPDFRLVNIDNGSTDGSCDRVLSWARERQVRAVEYTRAEAEAGGTREKEGSLRGAPPGRGLVVIRAGENLGFAGGNNIGLRYALARGARFVMLLNNDTIVSPDALEHLTRFLEDRPDFDGATAQIRLYDRPEIVWNCGGDLLWIGARRYHYAGAHVSLLPKKGHRRISFLTNCASIYRTALFRGVGLLSTAFFMGEEDFEFSCRLKSRKRRVACCYDAVIQHKVSSAVGTKLDMTYLHYLDRWIDMRSFWPELVWHVWRAAYLPYVAFLTWKVHRPPPRVLARFLASLIRESSRLDGVDRPTYEAIIRRHGYLP